MIRKNIKCLVIDDNDMRDMSELLATNAKKKGIDVEFLDEFNIGSADFDHLHDDNNDIISEKVEAFYCDRYLKKRIDFIAVDFDFEDGKYDGLDMIRLIRKYNVKAQIVLYSGNLDDIIRKIVASKEDGNVKEIVRRIKTLVRWKIETIADRDDIGEVLLNRMSKEVMTLDKLLIQKVSELPPCSIRMPFTPQLDGKTNEEVLEILQKNEGPSNLFLSEFVERSLAQFVENYGEK